MSAQWLPLTAAQTGIWAGQQLDPTNTAYNTAEYLIINGPVDQHALAAALRQTCAEAETLHGRIVLRDGAPGMSIEPRHWRIIGHDFSQAAAPQAAALEWMQAERAQRCDLEHDQWFAVALLTLAQDQTWCYVRAHHIALDGYSFALLFQRIVARYNQATCGAPAPAAWGDLASIQAADARYQQSDQAAASRRFWHDRCANQPQAMSLSATAALAQPHSRQLALDLPLDLQARLSAALPSARISWADALIACVAAYVAHWNAADAAVLGLALLGRGDASSLRTPCMAMNIVPLCLPVDASADLHQLSASVAAERSALQRHAGYRHEHLRRELGLLSTDRRMVGPVVNIMPFPRTFALGAASASSVTLAAGPVDDIAFNITCAAERVEIRLQANPLAYSDAALAAHAQRFTQLVQAWLAQPKQPLAQVALPPAWTLALLDGGIVADAAPSVLARIQQHALHQPSTTALVAADQTWDYATLLRQAQAWAAQLAEHGVGAQSLVGVALPRSADAIIALLAVLLAGATYLPLDPQWPAARRAAIIEHARPCAVIASATLTHLPASVRHIAVDSLTAGGTYTPPPLAGDAPAYVMYTSGSTGAPKGVVISHAALSNFAAAAAARYGISPADRVLQFAPLHFDASIEEIIVTLAAGATLVVRSEQMLESMQQFVDGCAAQAISVLDLPTAFWHELAAALSHGLVRLPTSVHSVIIGGEAALPERVRGWLAAVSPSVRLFNSYGPTEATVVATVAELHAAEHSVPIGTPLAGVQTLLLADDGRPAAPEAEGELYLLGAGLALGYHRRPDLTAQHFVRLEQLPGAPRAYRTGDRACIRADGQLVFIGRSDAEFKISGQRIMPAEIEHVLLLHPSVRAAAVVGQVLPAGGKRLIAMVVLRDPAPTEQALREHVRRYLAAAVVPQVWLVRRQLPRSTSGKINRQAILEQAPPAQAAQVDSSLAAAIRSAWTAVLGADPLPPDADVFALGATSLHVIQVANHLGRSLGREITAAMIFQAPTLAALTQLLADGTTTSANIQSQLLTDATLDPTLQLGPQRPAQPWQCVLLTGATGFVGAHLLAELLHTTCAQIICLVRADTHASAAERLAATLRRYDLPTAGLAERVEAWPADLSLPQFGLDHAAWRTLAETCTAIIHSAANVSVLRDYASLRPLNVAATRQLVQLALTCCTPLHHISTLAVAAPQRLSAHVPETFIPAHAGLRDGYAQSKWAAERLLEQAAERGLPVTVWRLGRVAGAPHSSVVNANDLFWRMLQAGLPHGLLPDLDIAEVWSSVDRVAKVIVALAQQAQAGAQVYNLATEPLRYTTLFQWLAADGYEFQRLPLAAWVAALRPLADAQAHSTLAFFERLVHTETAPEPVGQFATTQLTQALARHGITLPTIDQQQFAAYLRAGQRMGLLPAPATLHPAALIDS